MRYHIDILIDFVLSSWNESQVDLLARQHQVTSEELLELARMNQLAGHKYLNAPDCTHFDPISGCRGH